MFVSTIFDSVKVLQDGFETGKTLFVGDSDLDFWPTTVGPDAFVDSYNVAVGGYTCIDVLNELDDLLQVFQPQTVVLVCGENDLGGGDTVATTFDRFRQVGSCIQM